MSVISEITPHFLKSSKYPVILVAYGNFKCIFNQVNRSKKVLMESYLNWRSAGLVFSWQGKENGKQSCQSELGLYLLPDSNGNQFEFVFFLNLFFEFFWGGLKEVTSISLRESYIDNSQKHMQRKDILHTQLTHSHLRIPTEIIQKRLLSTATLHDCFIRLRLIT